MLNSSIPSVPRSDLKCPYYFINTITPIRRGMASLSLYEAAHHTKQCRGRVAPCPVLVDVKHRWWPSRRGMPTAGAVPAAQIPQLGGRTSCRQPHARRGAGLTLAVGLTEAAFCLLHPAVFQV